MGNLVLKHCDHSAPFEGKDRCPVCRRVSLRCKHDMPYEGENACPVHASAFEEGFELAAQLIAAFVDPGMDAGSVTVVNEESVRAATARAIRRAFIQKPYVHRGELHAPLGGTFRVVKIDPEGSGMDWSGHLGKTIRGAERCCERCTVIFGYLSHVEIGPFVRGELEPLDDEARRIHDEIEAFARVKGDGV